MEAFPRLPRFMDPRELLQVSSQWMVVRHLDDVVVSGDFLQIDSQLGHLKLCNLIN